MVREENEEKKSQNPLQPGPQGVPPELLRRNFLRALGIGMVHLSFAGASVARSSRSAALQKRADCGEKGPNGFAVRDATCGIRYESDEDCGKRRTAQIVHHDSDCNRAGGCFIDLGRNSDNDCGYVSKTYNTYSAVHSDSNCTGDSDCGRLGRDRQIQVDAACGAILFGPLGAGVSLSTDEACGRAANPATDPACPDNDCKQIASFNTSDQDCGRVAPGGKVWGDRAANGNCPREDTEDAHEERPPRRPLPPLNPLGL